MQNTHDQVQARLADERAKLTGYDEELRSLEDTSRSKSSRITEGGLELQKLTHAIDKSQKEQTAATQTLHQMENEHDWISDEKELFGRTNTPYDFHGQNIAEAKSSLKNLTERFQGMKKKINPKVMNMIDSVEKKEASLKNMMKTVVRDKRKIEETIVSLDEYKKEALHKTWTKVNGDFGQIFADLLPGSFAKLDPPEGKAISDGLEVKVSLGKVWKQSLTELSGGQRYVSPPFYLPFPSSSPLTNTYEQQLPNRPLPHPRPPTIQARAHVHPRRSRCRPRPLTYPEHWPPDQDKIQGQSVHRREFEGWHVSECEPHLSDEVPRGDECGAEFDGCGSEVGGRVEG